MFQEFSQKQSVDKLINLINSSTNIPKLLNESKDNGLLLSAFPDFERLWGERGQQDAKWHPEGNVWNHTLLVLENLPQNASLELKLAALFHDIGKPYTFFQYPTTKGISNKGHEQVGALQFRETYGPLIGLDKEKTAYIAFIIEYHMLMHEAQNQTVVSTELLEWILKQPFALDLIHHQHADILGTTLPLDERLKRSNKEFLIEKYNSYIDNQSDLRTESLTNFAEILYDKEK